LICGEYGTVAKENGKLKSSKVISKEVIDEPIEMIDFEVEDNHNYFVDGLLSHNSEHVPFLCVGENTRIRIDRTSRYSIPIVTAKAIYNRFKNGKTIKVLSVDTKQGTMSYQPILKAEKTQQKEIILSFFYESVNKTGITESKLHVGYGHPIYVIGKGFIRADKVKLGDRVVYFRGPKFNQKTLKRKQDQRFLHGKGEQKTTKCKWCGNKFKQSTKGRQNACKKGICNNLKYRKYYMAEVTHVEKTENVVDMYDFTVMKNHNFIADNVLVKNCLDEIDLIQDPRVLEEATMIPCTYGKFFPLTCYLSTRKFAGGNMEQKIKSVPKAGGEILRWNILDVTERITHEEAKVNEPKVTKYITTRLPMETLTPDEYEALPKEHKNDYERIEAYAGIAEHPMLPVMKNMLVDRPQENFGGLYKSKIAVHNNFKATKPEMGEAQLLCNSPSAANLVYSRFDEQENVINLSDCYEKITGDRPDIVSYDLILYELKALGLPVYGGADWGFTDYTTLTVFTILPDGSIISLYNEMAQGLEIDDIVEKVLSIQSFFDIKAWYPDQNYPSYLKTLNRKCGKKWKKFKKDVTAGISALQTQIVNSSNKRHFFVLDTPNNQFFIDAFGLYKWSKDGKGNIIDGVPYHDSDGVSDVMDAIRYPMQILMGAKKKPPRMTVGNERPNSNRAVNESIMRQKIQDLTGEVAVGERLKDAKKIIIN